ncbi:MAB_1171c family putative transporter [Nocardia sp. BMG111209]|uniref:MAB_1171c family putative transporter n=1 Tax=Nocardia sp. BMG111209 TaxID=1160137 RepID=UPI00036294F2|nr:MAB_1171c family putative transporter [Nocardia sp. BMG111209]
MGFALTYGGIGTLALITFGWRLVPAVRNPSSARWAVAVAILCAAVGFEAAVPAIYDWIGRVSGVPNLATPIVYAAIATAVLAQLVWTAYLVAPQEHPLLRGRVVMVAIAAVVVTLAVLFAVAPVHDRSHATDFDDHYGTRPVVTVFLTVYLVAYSGGLVRLILLCRTWLGQVRAQVWLWRGLWLLAAGSTVALGYSVGKAVALAAAWAGTPLHGLSIRIAPGFAALGATIMLIGYLCPSLIPQAVTAVAQARTLPRLRPLWSALRAQLPEIGGGAPEVGRGMRNVRYRRVIEIRDALLRLQPYLGPDDGDRAERRLAGSRLRSEKRSAAIEAARIAAALRRQAAGAHGGGGAIFRDPPRPGFDGELDWLLAVASAFRKLPPTSGVADRRTSG